ncbi:unnamed protein product [Rhizopus stolonifer]
MPDVIIKEGYLSLKEEGLRAWIWSKRYCVLRDQSLTFHRNEAGQCIGLLFLKEIGSVTRIDLKPYCFEITAKDKTYYIACKSDEELYGWMDRFITDFQLVLQDLLILFIKFMSDLIPLLVLSQVFPINGHGYLKVLLSQRKMPPRILKLYWTY